MRKLHLVGLATAIGVAFLAVPAVAQAPACSDDVCTLIPPGDAAAVAPRLQIRELRDDDICYNDDDATWVPPSSVAEMAAQVSGGGAPTICYNDSDSSWVVPRQ